MVPISSDAMKQLSRAYFVMRTRRWKARTCRTAEETVNLIAAIVGGRWRTDDRRKWSRPRLSSGTGSQTGKNVLVPDLTPRTWHEPGLTPHVTMDKLGVVRLIGEKETSSLEICERAWGRIRRVLLANYTRWRGVADTLLTGLVVRLELRTLYDVELPWQITHKVFCDVRGMGKFQDPLFQVIFGTRIGEVPFLYVKKYQDISLLQLWGMKS